MTGRGSQRAEGRGKTRKPRSASADVKEAHSARNRHCRDRAGGRPINHESRGSPWLRGRSSGRSHRPAGRASHPESHSAHRPVLHLSVAGIPLSVMSRPRPLQEGAGAHHAQTMFMRRSLRSQADSLCSKVSRGHRDDVRGDIRAAPPAGPAPDGCVSALACPRVGLRARPDAGGAASQLIQREANAQPIASSFPPAAE